MNDKLFMPLTSPLDSLLALRDALTEAVQSPSAKTTEIQSLSSTTKPKSTTTKPFSPSSGATCASTLTAGGIPVSGRRKIRYQPGPLNVSLFFYQVDGLNDQLPIFVLLLC